MKNHGLLLGVIIVLYLVFATLTMRHAVYEYKWMGTVCFWLAILILILFVFYVVATDD